VLCCIPAGAFPAIASTEPQAIISEASYTMRDGKHVTALQGAGWQVLVVWECETKDRERLAQMLSHFLSQTNHDFRK
jgi:G:T-mismatch repair DNA endonuclease (very short patch repair protein)